MCITNLAESVRLVRDSHPDNLHIEMRPAMEEGSVYAPAPDIYARPFA